MAKPIEIQVDEFLRRKFLRRRARIVRRNEWECWIWQGCPDEKGYGGFACRERAYKAHRLSYTIFVGPIPPDLVIDHLCRTRNCVNPEHLEPVTDVENIRRGEAITIIQDRKTHCKYGHPFSGDNLRVDVSRRRGRQASTRRRCKECARQAEKRNRKPRKRLAKCEHEASALE